MAASLEAQVDVDRVDDVVDDVEMPQIPMERPLNTFSKKCWARGPWPQISANLKDPVVVVCE